MAIRQMSGVVEHLRRGAILGDDARLSDGQLLQCYIDDGDESAFAVLVRRYGPMVWGVCRRVLGGHHDAEDAFQAAFLVLARKAAAVAPRELLANWLYGVACNVAHKARALALRRRTRERQVTGMPEPHAIDQDVWRELGEVLDQELRRLPDKYRAPVVLCDLQGKSYKAAAQQLGCPEGTLAARLSRARALLAQRLTRRGVVLSAAALATALTQSAASASMPAALVSNTIKAAGLLAAGQAATGVISIQAATLSEKVVKSMFLKKLLRPNVVVLAIAALAIGACLIHVASAGPASSIALVQPAVPAAKAQGNAKKTDEERFVGTWRFANLVVEGTEVPEEFKVLARMTFAKGGKSSMTLLDKATDGTYKVVGAGKVDLNLGDMELGQAIYQFDGEDKVTICTNNHKVGARPEKFAAEKGSGQTLFVLQRAKPGEEKPTAAEIAKNQGNVDKIRAAAARSQVTNNLKQVGLAFHGYHDAYNQLPLHAIYSKDGKTPLLSWRVALLPFIGSGDLYNQFKLDEVWDSPHNKKLIGKMPAIYAPAGEGKVEEGRTFMQVFTGPGSLFDGAKKMKFTDITDGTSNTILAIDAKEPVIWTRPDDLVLPKAKDKMPEVGGQFKVVLVLMCDGSVHAMAAMPSSELLRALVTPAGGEKIDPDKMKEAPQ